MMGGVGLSNFACSAAQAETRLSKVFEALVLWAVDLWKIMCAVSKRSIKTLHFSVGQRMFAL
jgi:hypothetical protein